MKKHPVFFAKERRDSLSHSTRSDIEFGGRADDDEDYQYERQLTRAPVFDGVEPGTNAELVDNRRLSWFTASTGDIYAPLLKIVREDPMTVDKFKLLLKPPEFDHDDVMCAVQSFMKCLADYIPGIKHDKTFDTIKAVRKLVSHDDSIRLYGLLTHYCYWNIIYPVAKKVMHDIRAMEPQYQLFEGIDLDNESVDRYKLPKALRNSTGKSILHPPATSMNKNTSGSNNNYQSIDRMFHNEAKQSDTKDALNSHVENVLQQAADYHSEAGWSASMFSYDESCVSNVSLTLQEKENLYVQLETCILSIFRKMGKTKYSLVIGRQTLVSCCHIVTDEILTTIYPWFALLPEEYDDELEDKNEFGDKRNLKVARLLRVVNQRLRRLLHQSLSDLIDPSRAYTSTMLLLSFVGSSHYTSRILAAGKKSRLYAATPSLTRNIRGGTNNLGGKGKYYRTSAAVIALFGDSTSYQARQFLQRGSALYASIPGSVQPFTLRLRREQEKIQRKKAEEEAKNKVTWEKLLALAETNNVTQTHPDDIPLRATVTPNYPTSPHQRPSSSGFRPISRTNSPDKAIGSPLQRLSPGPVSPSRIGSASTRPQSTRSSMQVDSHRQSGDLQLPLPWIPKPLDFGRLFEDQPEAYYRPAKLFDPKFAPRRPQTIDEAPASPSGKSVPNSTLHSKMSNSATNIFQPDYNGGKQVDLIVPVPNSKDLPSNSSPKHLQVQTSFPFSPVTGEVENFRPITPTPILHLPEHLIKHPKGDEVSLASSTSWLSHEYGRKTSGTVATDTHSLVRNSLASVPISLRAKSALMTLMVDKSSRGYKNEIQTHQTRLRVSLLKGLDKPNSSL